MRFLDGGGEMGDRIRRFDWTRTSLGVPATWPIPLRTAVRMLLNTNHPMIVFWGSDSLCLYNDAFSKSVGPEQHPQILGTRARDAWAGMWEIIGPQLELVMSGGGSTWHQNQPVPMTRFGKADRAYWTYSYSPIHDDEATESVGGVIVLCAETTAQVLAEERSRTEEMRWRSLFVDAPGFMCVLHGVEHRFAYTNPAFVTFIGQRDIIGRPVADVLPEVASQGFLALLDRVFSTGVAHAERAAAVTLNRPEEGGRDNHRFIDFVMQPIRDPSGDVTGLFLLGDDATDRERAQVELRDSEQKYKTLADSVPSLVWITDADGVCEFVNMRWSDYTGTTLNGDTRQRWSDHIIQPDRDRILSAAASDVPNEMEMRIRRHDGSHRWFLTRREPRLSDMGAINGWYFSASDIDERRLLQQHLEENARRLSIATDAAELGIHRQQVQSGAIEWDDRARALWGFGPDVLITDDLFMNGVHPDDRAGVKAAMADAMRPDGAGQYHDEYRVVDPTGMTRWVRATGRVEFKDGIATELTGTVQDISRQKQTELELIETDRRKDVFLATLAHELRNPLAPIRNAAEVLASPTVAPAEIQWAQRVIARQSGHMASLLDDLLDVARLTQGRLELKRENLSVQNILAAAIETVQPQLNAKAHTVTMHDSCDEVVVYGDMLRLCQALTNVLANAAKYTDSGGSIHVSASCDDDIVNIVVSDSGIGIAPDAIADVFGMFRQSETALERAEGGLGIGLALVQSIVEMHGGRVTASSVGVGFGSQFRIALPRVKSADSSARSVGVEAAIVSTDAKRIIVADDNADAAESLAIWLRMHGHSVEIAQHGEECLSIAATFSPHVILLDIGMPRLNGYEVAQRIRSTPAGERVRLVALTGWGQPEDKYRALQAGFDAHLTKPPNLELVGEEVSRASF